MSTVVRWNPAREVAAMQGALDRLFDENWRSARNGTQSGSLSLDVHETDQAYFVSAVVPGVTAEALNISLHDGVLTISGEVPQPTHENARALLLERGYGKPRQEVAVEVNPLEQLSDADQHALLAALATLSGGEESAPAAINEVH